MDRLVAFAQDIGKIQESVARIETVVELGFERHSQQLTEQAEQLKALSEKTDTALLPIRAAKALVAFVGGASVLTGCAYGVYQFLVPVIKASVIP